MPRAGKILKNISIGNLWDEIQDIKQNLGMGFTRGNFKNIVRINKQGLQAGSGSFNEAPATIDPTGAATFRKIHQMMGWATKTWEDSFTGITEVDTMETYLTAEAAAVQASLTVADNTGLSVGMYVDISDGVNFERKKVSALPNGTTITLSENLENTYPVGSYVGRYTCYIDTGNGWAELPKDVDLGTGADGAFNSSGGETISADKNYTSFTVNAGHTVTITGTPIIKCQGTVTIAGTLNVTTGYDGGAGKTGTGLGTQGSSYTGSPIASTDANYGGGGGGNNYGSGAGGGYGVAGGAGTGGSGGTGGTAGAVYNDQSITSLYKGSGGGGGGARQDGDACTGGTGGKGGGYVKFICRTFVQSGSGVINANGNAGTDAAGGLVNSGAGGGGGGSGGSIHIQAMISAAIGTNKLTATGGAGGIGIKGGNNTRCDGGAGGNGRIRIESNYISGTTTPTYYSAADKFVGKFIQGTYITLVEPHQIDKQFVIFEVTRNWTARYNLNSAIAVDIKTVVIDGDKTGQFAIGDTVDIYDTNNYERERKLITAIDYNVTAALKTTVTVSSPFVNSYLTSGYIERVDIIPRVSITESVALEEHQELDWRGSEVSGSYVTDYYTYKAPEGGTYCYFILYFSVVDISLQPKCSNFKVTLYP